MNKEKERIRIRERIRKILNKYFLKNNSKINISFAANEVCKYVFKKMNIEDNE